MSQLTWFQVRDMYERACDSSELAIHETWLHINYAYRRVCAVLELPELHVPDATVDTVANQDYINMDSDVYSIDWIQDQETARKLDPEPNGMRGRVRFFESGEARPALGVPQFYVRKGNKIYLRDTPDAIRTLNIGFRFHPAEVDSSDETKHPITPPQYDMAMVKIAAGNYFELHPPTNALDGTLDFTRGQQLKQSGITDLSEPKSPAAEENLDRRQYLRQEGYSFNIGGR
jgi:hypothetical protein